MGSEPHRDHDGSVAVQMVIPADPRPTIAANVRLLREARGWTQEQLGQRLEEMTGRPWSKATMSALERSAFAQAGETDRTPRSFTAEEIVALAALFAVTPNDLFNASLFATCPTCLGTGKVSNTPAEEPTRQRRTRMTRALLREVAEVYRKAHAEGEPPTMAVAEHFTVSHRTATRWASEARTAGELGRAVGTSAGEADTQRTEMTDGR